jgi:hypothetical protein
MKKGAIHKSQITMLLLVLGWTFISFGQAPTNSGAIKFQFVCDSLQTVILAESTIRIHVLSEDQTELIQEYAYCSSKLTSLPPGKYCVFIESPKFCNEQINSVHVSAERVTFIELNLNRINDPDCINEKPYIPPVIQSCH